MSDTRDAFTDLVEATRAAADQAIVHERRVVTPDFAAVVAAARARDPEAISAEAVAEANALAPIIELGAGPEPALGGVRGEAELEVWIAAARELAEIDVATRRLAGVPPLPAAAPQPAPGRPWWAMALAIAAVLAGLGLAIPRLLSLFVAGNYREAASPRSQAEYLGSEPGSEGGVSLRPGPNPVAPITREAIPGRGPGHEPGQAAAPGQASEGEQSSEAEQAPEAERPSEAERPEVDPAAPEHSSVGADERDRIAALDLEAQARWAEGDLAGAEAQFREITRIAGRGRYADLAYGDLFTLARQRKAEDQQRALWTEYLERFPEGRFADDARAGLCRHAGGEREACWRAYLDDFPEGVHTRSAHRALGVEASAPDSP